VGVAAMAAFNKCEPTFNGFRIKIEPLRHGRHRSIVWQTVTPF
jgi:hypothetical protein